MPACRWSAAASLSYRYDTRQVWLLDLPEEPVPSLYDLCAHHADDLVVPRGWERVDQRAAAGPPEALASDAPPPPPRRDPAPAPEGPRGNRYAALVQDLPRLAARVAAEARVAEGVGREARSDAGAGAVSRQVPLPSRELAPLPVREPVAAVAASPSAGGAGASVTAPHPGTAGGAGGRRGLAQPLRSAERMALLEVPGQLAMPVADEEQAVGEAVVVSISTASGRRRAPAPR